MNPPSSPEKKKKSRWRLSNPPVSPTFPNGGGSSGSLADRIRKASRSPPGRHRAASGEAGKVPEEDNSSKAAKSVFGWLAKNFDDKKHQYEREKEKEREKERRRAEREISLQVEQFMQPKMLSARPTAPTSPLIQLPAPSSQFQAEGSPMTPIQEKQTPIPASPVDGPSEPLLTAQLQSNPKFESGAEILEPKRQASMERISIPGESIEPEGRALPEAEQIKFGV
jgi:hypothetical protein